MVPGLAPNLVMDFMSERKYLDSLAFGFMDVPAPLVPPDGDLLDSEMLQELAGVSQAHPAPQVGFIIEIWYRVTLNPFSCSRMAAIALSCTCCPALFVSQPVRQDDVQ